MKKTIITLLLTVLAVFLAASMRANTVTEGVPLPDPVEALEPIKAVKTTKAEPKEPVKAVVAPKPVVKTVGDWVTQCYAWAKAAGVPLNDAAIKLLERESHCNPSAWNASSGAGGIPQALPFSKTGCELSVAGAVCQIKWFHNYCMVRYGSYEAALSHSLQMNWY